MSLPFRIAISSTFTSEPLEPVLRFWEQRMHREFEPRFAPYNQTVQTMHDPAGVFAGAQPGINVVLLRADDLGADPAQRSENAREMLRHIAAGARNFSRPLVVCECPASPGTDGGFLSEAMNAELAQQPEIHRITGEKVFRLYPVDGWYSEQGDRLASIPYTEEYFAALGTMLVRTADMLTRNPFKVLVLDCDNTIWRGVCGEDGPGGVAVEPERRAMHKFFLRKRESGMLLAIASKNNDADVQETFRLNPEMPLQLEHFAARRVNWDSKAGNIRALAAELNLGLDSFLFIDDDPKECAEVSAVLPEVLTLPLPHDAAAIQHFLDHIWPLDEGVVTADDRRRAESYQKAREFEKERQASASIQDFVADLNLEVSIVPVNAERLPRTAQLTQRTNQFNATTIRRRENEIRDLVSHGAACWTVDVTDRFANHGQTGVLIFQLKDGVLEVDTFLLSCRVLGRGVEYEIIRRLGEEALRLGCGSISIGYEETAKNQIIREFLSKVTGQPESPFTITAEAAINLVWTPSEDADARKKAPGESEISKAPANSKQAAPARPDYWHIARNYSHAGQILAAMRSRAAATLEGEFSGIELRVARIWSELLGVPSVQVSDNFFDLGGHSLLVVLLQVRIKETFGVELDVDEIHSGSLTLRGLADKIEIQQAGGLSDEEYARLAAEIDALSDEEVLLALQREEGAN